MESKLKGVLRWLVRRDADAGSTVLGGYVQDLGSILTVILGVSLGLTSGLIFYIGMKMLKVIAGWIDWKLKVTPYRIDYTSRKAPANVRILYERKHRKD